MKKKGLAKRIEYLEMLVADLQTKLTKLEEDHGPRLIIQTQYDLEGKPVYFVSKTGAHTLDDLNYRAYNRLDELNTP